MVCQYQFSVSHLRLKQELRGIKNGIYFFRLDLIKKFQDSNILRIAEGSEIQEEIYVATEKIYPLNNWLKTISSYDSYLD